MIFAGCKGLLSDFSNEADGSGISSGISDIFVSPSKRSYAVPGTFKRADINVFAVYSDGSTKKIPSDSGDLEILIDGTPYAGDVPFSTAGTRCIQVIYKGKEFIYTVNVGSSDSTDPGTEPPGGGSSIDIVINW
jgi:hypothetical protein